MIKFLKKRLKEELENAIDTEIVPHWGSSCDDVTSCILHMTVNKKSKSGSAVVAFSGVTCKGTDWYPNGSPFVEYHRVVFKFKDQHITWWDMRWNYDN